MENKYELDMVSIRLVKEPGIFSDKKVRGVDDAVEVIGEYISEYDREIFCVMNVKTDGSVINMNIVSQGTLNSSEVSPREVFKSSILSNSAAVLLFHNVVVKLFCNICGLNLLDCCLEAIGTVRFYQWCFAPLRGHAIDKICHFRFFAITQSNQETCFRRPLCCCPHLVWCAVTVIAMWAHMIVGSIGEFLHRVIEFLFRPKFVQIRAFVL